MPLPHLGDRTGQIKAKLTSPRVCEVTEHKHETPEYKMGSAISLMVDCDLHAQTTHFVRFTYYVREADG